MNYMKNSTHSLVKFLYPSYFPSFSDVDWIMFLGQLIGKY